VAILCRLPPPVDGFVGILGYALSEVVGKGEVERAPGISGQCRLKVPGRGYFPPLHTCIIELPEGVKPVTTVGISKSEWNVQQAMVGKQPEIFLSPKFKGLHQNIVVAVTDQGRPINYEIRLVSDAVRYVPALKIEDSGGEVRSWKAELGNTLAGHSVADHKGKAPRVLPLPNIRLNHINLHWSIHCSGGGWFASSDCKPIRPLRVYDWRSWRCRMSISVEI